ncbi:MAG: polysaccharide biosynthesis/export family protein [Bacteroidales bacterium]
MLNRPLKNRLIIVALVGGMVMTSCSTAKDVSYFQNIEDQIVLNEKITTAINYEPIIGINDRLLITVSSLDPNGSAPFNLPAVSYLQPGDKLVAATPNLQSYLVGVNGTIDFPIIGSIKVEGLTKLQLVALLKDKISTYLSDPLVNIEFMNYRVSVLGEVNRPGSISVSNDRVSILDAIAMAGDLTIYGERSNIMLIRESNGKREFHRFDLTNSELFASPYFYLRQNDVVYVEPNRPRQKNSKFSQTDQFNLSLVSVVVSAASVIASLLIALLIK